MSLHECTTENWEEAPDHRGRIGLTNPVVSGHLIHVDVVVTTVARSNCIA